MDVSKNLGSVFIIRAAPTYRKWIDCVKKHIFDFPWKRKLHGSSTEALTEAQGKYEDLPQNVSSTEGKRKRSTEAVLLASRRCIFVCVFSQSFFRRKLRNYFRKRKQEHMRGKWRLSSQHAGKAKNALILCHCILVGLRCTQQKQRQLICFGGMGKF